MKRQISVSNLVSFACRTGDLDFQGQQGPTAQQGIKAHQKIQKECGPEAQAEVAIKVELKIGSESMTLSGRMDLLYPADSPPRIQEIKSTLVAPDKLPDSMTSVHWAQLKVYGYCYLLQQRNENLLHTDSKHVQLNLLWFNINDDTQSIDVKHCSFEELEEFTLSAANTYLAWIKRVEEIRSRTKASAKKLGFPYGEFRAGQRDMAAATYRVARDAGHLLCEAPTGVGKGGCA